MITIFCDYDGCVDTIQCTRAEVGKARKKKGWLTKGADDYCPRHKGKAYEAYRALRERLDALADKWETEQTGAAYAKELRAATETRAP